jgi:hypothetical protein
MKIVCIRDFTTSFCRCTEGKTYQVLYEDSNCIEIVIEDDDGMAIALNKEEDIGLGFDYHFKYLQEVRHNKLESLGI